MENGSGKVAVITGGGSGLGRELALACARRGMHLVLGDVDEAGLAATTQLVAETAPSSHCFTRRVDVSRLDEVEALAAFALDKCGQVDVLFNNAGVGVGGPIWENTAADWQWVLGVNLYGVAWGIKTFVPLMLKRGGGHIVNIASAAGWMNAPGSGIYNVSKCAVVAMSETLANDLKDAGSQIGVSVVSPAFFPTGIAHSGRNRPAALAETAPDSEQRRLRESQVQYAVEHGKISAHDIAESILSAVESRQFYVFPHKKIKNLVSARAQAANNEISAFDPHAPL